jgi:hypothetical protein
VALTYALLDGRGDIDAVHLRAALAIWEYAEASAEYIWCDAVGDPIADEILSLLRNVGAAGKSRTEIRDHFGRNRSADKIGTALERLRNEGNVTCRRRQSSSAGGRPAEVWTAVLEAERWGATSICSKRLRRNLGYHVGFRVPKIRKM